MTTPFEPRDTWTHPLIRTLDRPLNRRKLIAGTFAAASAIPFLQLVSAQETSGATPETELQGDNAAVTLLKTAVSAVAALKTFRFELKTTRGSSTIFQGLELESVKGVVRRPLDIQATVTVKLPFGEMSAMAVGVDGEYWLQDPLNNDEWISLGNDPQIQALINPDQLLLYAIRVVHDAKITGAEKVDGADTTVVEGVVDFSSMLSSVVSMTGKNADMVNQVLTDGPKDVTFWIDGDNRVVEGEIRGPIFSTESDDVVRVLSLFDFDKPVDIEVPSGV